MISKRLGGKGTKRIIIKKKKYVNCNKYINLCKKINNKINKIPSENLIKLKIFLDKYLNNLLNKIKRKSINRKNGLKIQNLNGSYIYKNLFNINLKLKNDYYVFINKNFKKDGKEILFNFVKSIINIINKKDYLINNDNCYDQKYNIEKFNESLNFFNISSENKVHFTDIREQYELKLNSENEDKNLINYHFIILRNQYNDYLKSFHV